MDSVSQLKNKYSALGKIWRPREINHSFAMEISRFFQINDFLSRIIATRVNNLNDAHNFLDPKLKNIMPDPFHLLDMDKGVERVIKAFNLKEKICIFADYDVDGATGSALLKNVFSDIGIDSKIYIPDRIIEGYGPNVAAMQRIKDNGTNLIITVDCGSVAFDALDKAYDLGMDVIIIDHHISLDLMPKAVAVINPNRLDETTKYKNLAAVGVAFLFVVALVKRLKDLNFFAQKPSPDLMQYLDIVALGTVCDVMTLTELNRAFVTQGLKIAKQRRNIGYKHLCDVAAIDEEISCYHLGYVIGPRINAGGRIGKANLGSDLLCTKSEHEALKIAKELDQYNADRKIIEIQIMDEASRQAELQRNDPMIFVLSPLWHQGVIGIVAGRLKERYNKPVAVIAIIDEDGQNSYGKASCRSVRGIDFGAKIFKAQALDLITSGGGHAMAAGFSVPVEKIELLKNFLNAEFEKDMLNSRSHVDEFFDLEITSSAINIDMVNELALLEPYGHGNPSPIFCISDLFVLKADIVGAKHIKALLAPDRAAYGHKALNVMAFNSVGTKIGDMILSKYPNNITIFGHLKKNSWQGRDTVQFILQDLQH